MRVTGFVALACLALAGCDNVVTSWAESQALAAVRTELRDPGRARFSETGQTPGGAVCGRVNAVNGYGGMTGAKRFIVPPRRAAVFEELEDPAVFDALWINAGCAKR